MDKCVIPEPKIPVHDHLYRQIQRKLGMTTGWMNNHFIVGWPGLAGRQIAPLATPKAIDPGHLHAEIKRLTAEVGRLRGLVYHYENEKHKRPERTRP